MGRGWGGMEQQHECVRTAAATLGLRPAAATAPCIHAVPVEPALLHSLQPEQGSEADVARHGCRSSANPGRKKIDRSPLIRACSGTQRATELAAYYTQQRSGALPTAGARWMIRHAPRGRQSEQLPCRARNSELDYIRTNCMHEKVGAFGRPSLF